MLMHPGLGNILAAVASDIPLTGAGAFNSRSTHFAGLEALFHGL
jgi:hypothetical protein